MKKIRIPISEKNCEFMPLPVSADPFDHTSDIQSETDNLTPQQKPTAAPDYSRLPAPEFSFRLENSTLPSYMSGRYEHPASVISISIPDADTSLVNSWVSNSAATDTQIPSETLVKRMTNAVIGAIEQYYTDAARAGLFSRPCRIGCAFRMADGNHITIGEILRLRPASRAPMMLVRESSVSSGTLFTVTEILNSPQKLFLTIPAFSIPDEYADKVTHLDIFATDQYSMLSGSESVTGIYSETYFGDKVKCWAYSRLDEDLVNVYTSADKKFRLIASIPIEEASQGVTDLRIPAEGTPLYPWNIFSEYDPDYIAGGGSGSGSGNGNGDDDDNPGDDTPGGNTFFPYIRLTTHALDLGMPEDEKRVRGISLRGLFNRDADTVTMTLWGSHHRENWHKVATVSGAHLRLLRGMKYRWWRVTAHIHMRRGDFIDAITFFSE